MEKRKPIYRPDDTPDIPTLENLGWDAMRQILDQHMPQKEEKIRVVPMYWRWMAAAILLLVLGVGSYVWLSNDPTSKSIKDKYETVKKEKQTPKKISSSASEEVAVNKHLNVDNIQPNQGKETQKQKDSQKNRSLDLASITSLSSQRKNKNASPLLIKSEDKNVVYVSKSSSKSDLSNNKNESQDLYVSTSRSSSSHRIETFAKNSKQKPIGLTIIPDKMPSSISNLEKKSSFQMEGKDLLVSKNNLDHKLSREENVEAKSTFRKRMNDAILQEEQSDSAKQAVIAANKKNLSDSQLVANRRAQLEAFFAQKENRHTESAASKKKAKVDLAILVNRNMTDKNTGQKGNSIYSLPIYPGVNASVKLSDKMGISAGVATAAPGNFTNTSISGPVAMSSPAYSAYISKNNPQTSNNDKAFLTTSSMTSKEISLLANTSSDIQQVYYWQIPLMFDYYLSHTQLKLSAGTDFSIMQRVLVGNAASSQLMDVSTYNNSGSTYQLRSFDPRLSIGAQYRLNRLLFGARFSRSFQPAVQYNGAATNGGNNQIFNFSIGYSFFK